MNLTIEHIEYGAVSHGTRVLHRKSLPFLILVHTVAGKYLVRVGGSEWRVSPGVRFLVPPNAEVEFEHLPATRTGQPMESLWAHITAVAYRTYDWADLFRLPAKIEGGASSRIGKLLRLGRKAGGDATLAGQAAAAARAYDLMSVLTSALPEKTVRHGLRDDVRLAALTRFMRQHLARPISVDDLARSVSLSRSHLHEMVRKASGKTPHRLLLELRVNEAAKRLVRPEMKIESVALECGFACPFHFSKTFKAIKGLPPSAYRAEALASLDASRGVS